MRARLCIQLDTWKNAGAGAIYRSQDGEKLYVKCPGCGRHASVTLEPWRNGNSEYWHLLAEADGRLTLEPAIEHVYLDAAGKAVSCWYGQLRANEWVALDGTPEMQRA